MRTRWSGEREADRADDSDQIGSVRFESLGFRAEALLKDYVRDRDGKTHDLCRPGA